MKQTWHTAGLTVTLALVTTVATAGSYTRVEGRAVGGGQMTYTVHVVHGGLVDNLVNVSVSVSPFTNRVGFGADPSGWMNNPANPHAVSWQYATNPLPRNMRVEFQATSSEPGIKKGNMFIVFGAQIWTCWFGTPLKIGAAGYSSHEVPLPCPWEEHDETAAAFHTTNIWVRDPHLSDITSHTLSFTWPTASTVDIQSSSNLTDWSHIDYVLGYTNTTTWTSAVPLSTYGDYYRVQLVSLCHNTNLAPRSLAKTAPPKTVLAARLMGSRIAVEVETEPHVQYAASLIDSDGGNRFSLPDFTGTGMVTTVWFPLHETDIPLFFHIVAKP